MYIQKFMFCRSELLSFIKKLRVSFIKIDLITIADFCGIWLKILSAYILII